MEVEKTIASAARDKLQLHTWYLCPETVVFAICSNNIPADVKGEMALALASTQRPDHIQVKKADKVLIQETTTLHSLISEDSYTIFDILDIDDQWLTEDPKTWISNRDYAILCAFILSLKVTNDTAERAVKMIKDYVKILTKDEDILEFIIQLVKQHREMYPNCL